MNERLRRRDGKAHIFIEPGQRTHRLKCSITYVRFAANVIVIHWKVIHTIFRKQCLNELPKNGLNITEYLLISKEKKHLYTKNLEKEQLLLVRG